MSAEGKPEHGSVAVKSEGGSVPAGGDAAAARKRPRQEAAEGGEVNEDRLTLAEFAKRRGIAVREETASRAPRKSAPAAAKKEAAPRKSAARSSSRASASGGTPSTPWDIRQAADRKQHMVTRVLIRWNYCIEWPDMAAMEECAKRRKPGFRALPGYPGIFVGVRNDVMGQYDRHELPLLEYEGVPYKPSRAALYTLPIAKLLALWAVACTNQLPPLERAVEEGDSYGDGATLANLRRELEYVINLLKRLSDAARAKLVASLEAELEARRDAGSWNVVFLEQQVDLVKSCAASKAGAPGAAAAASKAKAS